MRRAGTSAARSNPRRGEGPAHRRPRNACDEPPAGRAVSTASKSPGRSSTTSDLHDLRPGRVGRSWKARAPSPEPRHHGRHQPGQRLPGTIRKDFAESIGGNSVHGSDSAENAAAEIAYFLRRDGDRRLSRPCIKKRPMWAAFFACRGSRPSVEDGRRPRSAPPCRRYRPGVASTGTWPTRPRAMQANSSTIHRIVNSTSLVEAL